MFPGRSAAPLNVIFFIIAWVIPRLKGDFSYGMCKCVFTYFWLIHFLLTSNGSYVVFIQLSFWELFCLCFSREPSSVVWVNVLFDWDSCPLRPFESATEFREMLVQHISPSLGKDYRIRKLRMYGTKLRSTDPEMILIRQLASSRNTNVKCYAVPHPPRRPGKKKPVPPVYLMHLKILRYIIKFRPPFPVAIFSAHVEMNQPIQELRKRNYLVITAWLPKS